MPTSQSARISRRTFVAGIGTGAVIAATSSLPLAGVLAQSRPRQFVLREDRFGRIFPSLPPFAEASPALDAALRDIGKPGGMLDARDKLLAGPVQLIVDPALSVNNPNNPTHTAGTTFMGQFMDHDMTFDLTSRLGGGDGPDGLAQHAHAGASTSTRSTAAGRSRIPSCTWPVRGQPGASRPSSDRERRAVRGPAARRRPARAIIADPRNDENMMIAGLQAAFILFHNKAVDVV